MVDKFIKLIRLWPFHKIEIGRLDEYQYIPIRVGGGMSWWRAKMPGEVKRLAPLGSIPISEEAK